MPKKIVFTDIDNTLYDWGAFFAPSFRAMVYSLVRELSVSEDQLYREFKNVFARHGSLEYAFAIQELDSVRSLEQEEIRRLVGIGRGAFLSVYRKRLCPYSGVPETLKWLRDQGYGVVGVTNSPMYRAQKRLFDLKLDSQLTGLVAWEGYKSHTNPITEGYVHPSLQRVRTRIERDRLVCVPLSACKPNEEHYSIALEVFGGSPSECWVIGDSLSKDLMPAAQLGVKTIWARYGAGFNPEDRDTSTLLRITHWDEAQIRKTYSIDAFAPDYSVDSIEELRHIIPSIILTLF